MEEIFQKKTDEMDCQPGGPFVIQMLFKNPVELPEKEHQHARVHRLLPKLQRNLPATARTEKRGIPRYGEFKHNCRTNRI